MEENSFEKQVRQKMSGLKIPPSDGVWDHVKMNIEKRKSRRWLPLIFLFGSILLLSGLYYFSTKNSSSPNNKFSNNNITTTVAESLTINKIPVPGEELHSKEKTVYTKESISKKDSTSNAKSVVVNKATQSNISAGSGLEKTDNHFHNSPAEVDIVNAKKDDEQTKTPELKHEKEELIATANPSKNAVPAVREVIKEDPGKLLEVQSAIVAEEIKIETLSIASIIDTTTKRDIAQRMQTEIDTSKVSTLFKKSFDKLSKWHIGFLFTGGISHVGNQFLALGYNRADYLQNATPGSSTGGSPFSYPSKVKNGFGFIAGVFIEKDMSTRTHFSLGINYKEFNTTNLVGQKNDSMLSYSSLNANKRYNNNFKFIELPLKVRVQLGSSKKFPMYWSGGITLSQLIKSNALQFDPYTISNDPFARAYFTDNSFFNKTSLGLNTGFLATIFSDKKTTILGGPYLYYSASELASEGLYSKKHFVFLGLQTQIIFNKK